MKAVQIALFLALQNAVSFAQQGWQHQSHQWNTYTAPAPPPTQITAPPGTQPIAPPGTQPTAPSATQPTDTFATTPGASVPGNTATNPPVASSNTAQPQPTSTASTGGGSPGGDCHQLNFVGPGAPASTCVAGGTNPGITIGGNEGTKVEINAAVGGGSLGNDGGTLNVLDVSVCAGYSVPVQCVVSGGSVAGSPLGLTAGGTSGFGSCPNNAAATDSGGVCINNESHNVGSDNVDQFFKQPGYWYWDNDGTPHVNWVGWQTITCTIGGGGSKRDLGTNDTIQGREALPEPEPKPIVLEAEANSEARAHLHKKRAHARALGSLFQIS